MLVRLVLTLAAAGFLLAACLSAAGPRAPAPAGTPPALGPASGAALRPVAAARPIATPPPASPHPASGPGACALPRLIVDGALLERADTGEPVQLKGVALYAPERRPGESICAFVSRNLEANERLGIRSNLVRLSFDVYDLVPEDIAGAADYLAGRGIYLVLTPHNVVDGRWQELPNDRVVETMGRLAGALAEKSNVIYGLWNEPGEIAPGRAAGWRDWSPWIQRIGGAILEQLQGHAPPLFLVPGLRWARDLRGADIPLPASSYLVDVHDYRWTRGEDVRAWWTSMLGRVPVLISELAGYIPAQPDRVPYQSAEDIRYMRETLDTIVNNPLYRGMVHYTTWRGEDTGDGLRTADGRLTPRGALIREDLEKYPAR
jgi:hypothetical protein